MKIGLYKLGINISDIKIKNDKNGRFKEILALKEIFESQGHKVELLDRYSNLSNKYFDKIYVLNGELSNNSSMEILFLSTKCDFIGYILTDLRLINENISRLFNVIYTQSIENIPFIHAKQCYNGMPELALYCNRNKIVQAYNNFDKKENMFIFGGGIRNRRKDIEEYIIKTGFTYYGKDEENGFDNRIPIDEYYKKLENTKYSILIQDPEYNYHGFITWRYYENIAHGIITFIDHKCDKYNMLGLDPKVKQIVTVHNKQDMIDKMIEIERSKTLQQLILSEQYVLITPKKIHGLYTYDCLI